MKSSAKKAKSRAHKQKAKRRSQVTPAIREKEESFKALFAEWESRRGRTAANAPSTTAPSSVSSSSATADHSPMTKMTRALKAVVSRQPAKKRRVEERTAYQELESEIDESSVYSPCETLASGTYYGAMTGHSDPMDTSQISYAEQCESEEDSLDESEGYSPTRYEDSPPVSSSRNKARRPSGIRDDPTHSPEFYMGPDPSQYSTKMSDADMEHEMAFRRSHADSAVEFLTKRNQDARDAQDGHSGAFNSDEDLLSDSPMTSGGPQSSAHDELADASADAASDSAESSAHSDFGAPCDDSAEVLRNLLSRRGLAKLCDETKLWDAINQISGRHARQLLFHEILHRLRHRHVIMSLFQSEHTLFDIETEILGRPTWTTLYEEVE